MRRSVLAALLSSTALLWCGAGVVAGTDGDALRSIWLVDDFEDQDLVGWSSPTGPCNISIAAFGAGGSSYSLAVNGACGHYGGTHYDLAGYRATGVSLAMRPSGPSAAHLYVVLDDDDSGVNGYLMAFLVSADGWFIAYGADGVRYDLMPYDGIRWYDLDLDIDWVGRNVDVFIDGVARQYNIPFDSETIATLHRIHLYNFDMASAWYDQIIMSDPPPSPGIMSDGFESADETGWSMATPALPKRLVLYDAGGVAGALGGRPGADVLCGQAAVGMPGIPLHATTRAFLSVSGGDSISLMPSYFGVPTDRVVTGPNRTLVANSWADLMDGSIDRTLANAGVVSGHNWYSGSDSDGTVAASTCSGWTDGSGSSGRYGYHSTTGVGWISSGNAVCGNATTHVLCLAWR